MDEYGDDSWMDSLSVGDIFDIAEETTGLGEQYSGTGTDLTENDPYIYKTPEGETMGPTNDPYIYKTPEGETMGPTNDPYIYKTPEGETMGPQRQGSGGGGIFGELNKFVEGNKDTIGLGAGALMYWGKTISDNRNASQAEDAAWWKRAETAQDKQDAINRAVTKSDTDWDREKERTRLQNDFITETNKQKQKDQLEIIAAQNAGRSSGGGGGGGGIDQAAARAARVSASIMGMKKPTTGIVNSNIWGNAMNTLQRK